MKYNIVFMPKAEKQLAQWRKSGQLKALHKIHSLLLEIGDHPFAGSGQVEALRGDYAGMWSRRIDKHNRIIYSVSEEEIQVHILSLKGHYD